MAAAEQFVDTPDVEEEEDEEDPQDVLKEKCAELPRCSKLSEVFNECEDRVNSKSNTSETCTQELIDFVGCVDHCVANNLFKQLK